MKTNNNIFLENLSLDSIRTALLDRLPDHLHFYVDDLVRLLINSAKLKSNSKEMISPINLDEDFMAILEALAGKKIRTHQALLEFGQENQLGDVQIGDIAGNNVVKITFNVHQNLTSTQRKRIVKEKRFVLFGIIPLWSIVSSTIIEPLVYFLVGSSIFILFGVMGITAGWISPFEKTQTPFPEDIEITIPVNTSTIVPDSTVDLEYLTAVVPTPIISDCDIWVRVDTKTTNNSLSLYNSPEGDFLTSIPNGILVFLLCDDPVEINNEIWIKIRYNKLLINKNKNLPTKQFYSIRFKGEGISYYGWVKKKFLILW